jgi:hypothetical protein
VKRQLFNLITVSLTTSVLLASAQKAFGHSVEAQTNIIQAQPLVHNIGSVRGELCEWTHNQGMVQKEQATKQTTKSSQPRLAGQTTQVSNTLQGIFFIFLFSGYILGGLGYRKHRAQRAATLRQQIEMLERIWRIRSQQ